MVDADPVGTGPELQPVRAGGAARPVAVAVAIGVFLAALVWQPWGRAASAVPAPPPAIAVVDGATPSPPVTLTPGTPLSPSPAPSRSSFSTRGPRPSFGAVSPGRVGVDTTVSLLDDEWTVVAFLAREGQMGAAEPWISNGTGAARAPGGTLVVLQQQLSYTLAPMERPEELDVACRALGGYQHPAAAHLPADPVAYIGVTFPGMSPRAKVSVVALERAGLALKRLPALIVPTNDSLGPGRYTVPSSGEGGAVLFAMAPLAILPTATYRFEIRVPGLAGPRYLYACVDP